MSTDGKECRQDWMDTVIRIGQVAELQADQLSSLATSPHRITRSTLDRISCPSSVTASTSTTASSNPLSRPSSDLTSAGIHERKLKLYQTLKMIPEPEEETEENISLSPSKVTKDIFNNRKSQRSVARVDYRKLSRGEPQE